MSVEGKSMGNSASLEAYPPATMEPSLVEIAWRIRCKIFYEGRSKAQKSTRRRLRFERNKAKQKFMQVCP